MRAFLALGRLRCLRRLGCLGCFGLLELGEAARHRDRRDDRLVRVVEKRDVVDRRDVGEAQHVAHLHVGDVELDVLRHVRRQRLDMKLARDEREHPARLHAGRLTDELHDDGGMDRLVEPNLTQVDVRDGAADRILLVLGEDRRMHGLLALDDDVEDGVEPRRARHRRTKLPLRHDDRACMTLPVQDAGDEALRAEAPSATRADVLALAHFELQPVSRHGGGL